jgi:hypothetical protein
MTRHIRALALLFATAAIALATSCGRFVRGSDDTRAFIQFVNQSLSQADVFAVDGVRAIRMGTVMPGRTDTLEVPSDVVHGAGTLNVVARLLASSYTPRTGQFSIGPGEMLQVTLPPDARSLVVLPVR